MSDEKPSKAEDEYFARLEFERRRKEIEARQAKLQDEERARLKQLHHMRCPKCGMELAEVEFKGIKVDRCVACNGLWFDGGEIDQVLAQGKSFFGRLGNIFK
ncbi:MAG: zf-TFIIB domain-containing protein [Acidobacteria bacterium]|nr:zf-TFIIB domain-containing protein [Acidobacteriota bacterium]